MSLPDNIAAVVFILALLAACAATVIGLDWFFVGFALGSFAGMAVGTSTPRRRRGPGRDEQETT